MILVCVWVGALRLKYIQRQQGNLSFSVTSFCEAAQLYSANGGWAGDDLTDSSPATFTDIWSDLLKVAVTNHSQTH